MTNSIQQLTTEYKFKYIPDFTKFNDSDNVVTEYVVNTDDCETHFCTTEDEVIQLIKTGTVWDVRQHKSIPLPETNYIDQINDELFNIMKNDMKEDYPDVYAYIKDMTSVKQVTDEDVLNELVYQLVEFY